MVKLKLKSLMNSLVIKKLKIYLWKIEFLLGMKLIEGKSKIDKTLVSIEWINI